MQITFTHQGDRITLSRTDVERAIADVEPEPIRQHAVEVHGRAYPVKQVFAAATGLATADFQSHRARDILRRLGYREPVAAARDGVGNGTSLVHVLRVVTRAGGSQDYELADEEEPEALERDLAERLGGDGTRQIGVLLPDAVGGVGRLTLAWGALASAVLFERPGRRRP